MKTQFFTTGILSVFLTMSAGAEGIKPVGANGKVLNLDFETGTLRDWTATGSAFEKQPIHGDTVAKRRADMKSSHQGDYWIGTFENSGDEAQGTLTSSPFAVAHPYASFLVAGGSGEKTRVELVDTKSDKVIFKCPGYDHETLRPVVVDLRKFSGEQIYIRLVDEASGGWGHINFDDFEFYDEKPSFPNALDPKLSEMPEADKVMYAGLTPEDAAQKMTLPPGFKATLFAGEPDVKQPIAMAFDHRGRLWIAEAYTYPIRAKEGEGKDRILVFEDTDGDGKFDKRTVFMEGLNLVSGLEVGFGGVWVGAAPYLMFIPIADGDEPKPAGKPQIILDGWAYQDTHETLNTFQWGPDGWLYGCQGVFTHSNVGKPGAPDSERTPINAGVWRLHPVTHKFEQFAEGTSNPWGVDFDEHGQCIVEACVIPHLFHMIQGGRFTRQAGSHFNPFVYDDIKTIADHVHYSGNKGPHAGNGRSDAAGGGHAHAGLLIYQGDNWPSDYQGKIFMNNIHGARINMDIPEREGSGFVGHHGADFINFNDTWSQILNLETGPDGGVYMIDWYDKNQCHHTDPNGHDRSNGRVFKIIYDGTGASPRFAPPDLTKKSNQELADIQLAWGNHGPLRDNWQTRHARRVLQERAATGALKADEIPKILAELPEAKTYSQEQELRMLWLRHVTGALTPEVALSQLHSTHEFTRAWTIQLLCEGGTVSDEMLKEFNRMAVEDVSPVVRLYLASAMQRLPVDARWNVVEGLFAHAEDAGDHNLPLMYWYAAMPLAAKDYTRALNLAASARVPNMLSFTVRRTAALNTPEAFAAITKCLLQAEGAARQKETLDGLSQAFAGQRHATMPADWSDVEIKLAASKDAGIRAQVQSLSLIFGSANALTALRKTLSDSTAAIPARRTALESLLAAKDPELPPILQGLLEDAQLRGSALRGLALYEDAKTPDRILNGYGTFAAPEKRDALNTLAARVISAKALLAAIGAGAVPRADVTADIVRQLRNLKDAGLNTLMEKVWGAVRETSADKKPMIEKYKGIYLAGGSQPGDASRGRAVFARTCQQCHTLFDTGGKVGPDLTGSNRGDLNYILENIVDPNAVIPNDYRAWTLETTDDRTITGIVKQQDDKKVLIVTPNETLTVPRAEIKSLTQNQLSMMPEGLLDSLKEQEVRDLIYYLGRPGQVELPK